MNSVAEISTALIEFFHAANNSQEPVLFDTDLLASGRLDSLLVMDLVSFLEARFQVRMQPHEINPHNLRSIKCLTDFVHARGDRDSHAA